MSVELYFDMIGRKTAALIAASIEAGALLATDDEEVIARYRALRLGARPRVPAQRRPARDLGRRAGDRQGADRPRAPQEDAPGALRASSTRARGPRAACASCTSTSDPAAADVAEIVAILERTGARDYTRDQARRYRDEALAELDAAGVSTRAARERLEAIIVCGHHRLGGLAARALVRVASVARPSPRRLVALLADHEDLAHPPAVGRLDRQGAARRPAISSPGDGTPPIRWYTRPPTVSYSSSSSSGEVEVEQLGQVVHRRPGRRRAPRRRRAGRPSAPRRRTRPGSRRRSPRGGPRSSPGPPSRRTRRARSRCGPCAAGTRGAGRRSSSTPGTNTGGRRSVRRAGRGPVGSFRNGSRSLA